MNWLRTSGRSLGFAILLSFALWVYVSYSENPDRSSSFENMLVEVVTIPKGLVIVDQEGLPRPDQTSLSTVNVVVKADQETLSTLRQSYLSAFVDLSGLSPGDHQVPVNVELNRTDLRIKDFSDLNTDPEFVQVRLDELITNTIPLTIEVQGNLPSSFEQSDPKVTSNGKAISQVVVEGPQGLVERVSSAQAVVNIDQLSTSYIGLREIQAFDANEDLIEGVTLVPSLVKVTVPIRSVVGLKRVPVLGAIDGTPAAGYIVSDIQSDPPLVTISGSSRRLDEIEQISTEPIDIRGATSTITRQVDLILPPRVSSQSRDVADVMITVNIEPLERPFQVQLPFAVEVEGVADNLKETHTPEVIRLLVSGLSESLAQINVLQMVALVDVTGRDPGTYTLSPRVTLPEGVTIVDDVPNVSVVLERDVKPTPTPTLRSVVRATTDVSATLPFLPTSAMTNTEDIVLPPDSDNPSSENPVDEEPVSTVTTTLETEEVVEEEIMVVAPTPTAPIEIETTPESLLSPSDVIPLPLPIESESTPDILPDVPELVEPVEPFEEISPEVPEEVVGE